MPEKLLLAALLTLIAFAAPAAETPRQAMQDGNFRDAVALLETRALDPNTPPRTAANDLADAIRCHEALDDPDAARDLLARAVAARPDSWRILAVAARPSAGRGRGREAERRRGIGLLLRAEAGLDDPADPATPGDRQAFYRAFADLLTLDRTDMHAWRLADRTDLEADAGPDDEVPYYALPRRHAPVDGDGEPVYHRMPASWDEAATDGERWRWILGRLAAAGPDGAAEADLVFGRFLLGQFGVQTITQDSPLVRDADLGGETGPFAVRTLTERETIARLATGLKRFSPPDDFNHIAVLRRAADAADAGIRADALRTLARLFENRQQYHKAVSFWDRIDDPEAAAERRRITGNNGALETGPVAPAGRTTTLSYLYRNGSSVRLKATRLDEERLLADIRERVKSGTDQALADYVARRPEALGRLVAEGNERYIADVTAEWEVALDPLPDYYSRRAAIDLPFTDAGCYLIEAAMQDGNTSRLVLWLHDLALVRHAAGDRQLYFVADAATGEPVADAALSFLGYRFHYTGRGTRARIESDEFAARTDADGMHFVPVDRLKEREWLVAAAAPDGRRAYLGFAPVWPMHMEEADRDDAGSCFILTDRPAYRPDQTIHFKAWYGEARYDGRPVRVENRPVAVTVYNPRGETIYEKTLHTDAYGGAADSFVLGPDAPLGYYHIATEQGGGVGFRLEEYKKPEFEVLVDAPDAAVPLGDTARLTIRAAYYFGAPVADATVRYKIVRTTHRSGWNPPWRWDWLYGAGAWRRQPARAPGMPWIYEQPEVVAEGEGSLDPDGVFRLALDTAPAKALFGDRDHAYAVTAEVTDRSRRVIVGTGTVVATRQPFSVEVWSGRGYVSKGDAIDASVRAALPLGGGVKATGKATLYRIRYTEDGSARETEHAVQPVETDADGNADVRFEAGDAGQYRIAVALEDAHGNRAEGGMAVTVRGPAGDGGFRFAELELAADRRDYAPGDTLRLAVSADNAAAPVVLFVRPGQAEGATPQLLRLENGSRVVDIPVGRGDQPNFFVEALTVYEGRLQVATREIFVPPADKTLTVEVTPDKPAYRPGEEASFTVRVADPDGAPVRGQCVISVYDRAVDYIAGGGNAGDIRAFFWSWKRHYGPDYAVSLSKSPYPAPRRDDVRWEPIGVFGAQEADWNDDMVHLNGAMPKGRMQHYGGGMPVPMLAAPAAAPMQEEAAMDSAAAMPTSGGMGESGAPDGMAGAVVRSDFADTALWLAALETDADGRAAFSLVMPDNLTAWKARAWVMADNTRVGEAEAAVETTKNVLVRPQTPRFLTQKDRVVLSANVHNYLPRAKTARVELTLEGGLLEPDAGSPLVRELDLAAGGEARVDWVVHARRPGEARVVMTVLTDEESDAAASTLPVLVHGARRVEGFGGVLRGDDATAAVRFTVPDDRLAERSRLEVAFSPSVASAMLEALPFLLEYPYGCTEQTLNRFLPAVTTRAFLDRLGATLDDARHAAERARDDAQSAQWRGTWGDPRAAASPVFDDAVLADIAATGLYRLAAMQNGDGGWGWFSGAGGRSWPHTTAVVVHGLLGAARRGLDVPAAVLDSGIDWLRGYQQQRIERIKEHEDDRAGNLDAFVYMILAEDGRRPLDPDMRDFLYQDRLSLSPTALAMFGLALHAEGATNALDMVLRNLAQHLRTDPNGTAWLHTPADGWWRWDNDAVETQTWYLKLLTRTDPAGDAAGGVAKYLLHNRRNGSYWQSTRDTAYAVDALAEYAVASGEAAPDMTVVLLLDGRPVLTRTIAAKDALATHRFSLEGVAVEAGEHELRLERTGTGSVYYSGSLDLFSLEDPIPAAGGDLSVARRYARLPRDGGREPLPADGSAVVRSGDVVEAELTITAKNDYEYVVFEDMKAAGLEAVELRSGYAADALGAYVEYRDEKVVVFVRSLPRGVHTLRYRFRAEAPGAFSALPTFGGGMYAADLFANSDEMKIRITEE